MRFAKGHGTENDFVILPDPDGLIGLTADLAARLCDRRTGLGADGVLRAVRRGGDAAAFPGPVGPAEPGGADVAEPEWFMDCRNADGSSGEMCGNGIRVFCRYLIDHELVRGPEFAVATLAGTRRVRAGPGEEITVDMGLPRLLGPGRAVLAGRPLDGLMVSLGNPHLACVVTEPVDCFDLSRPPALPAGLFPEGANLELVRLLEPGHAEMRVYERGCGPTRSCGTGAVAAAVAVAVGAGGGRAELVPAGDWTVELPGGRLRITLDCLTSFLSGPAVIVAEGELDEAWLSGRTLTPSSASESA